MIGRSGGKGDPRGGLGRDRQAVPGRADADPGHREAIRHGYTDEGNNLTEVTNPPGLPPQFTYYDHCRGRSWTDTNSHSYHYEYGAQDRCIAEGGSAGHMRLHIDYDGTDRAYPGHEVTTTTTGGFYLRSAEMTFRIHQELDATVVAVAPAGANVEVDSETGFIDQVKHPSWWDENSVPTRPGDRLHVVVLDASREPPRLRCRLDWIRSAPLKSWEHGCSIA